MHITFNYRLNAGQYVLFKNDEPTTAPVDEIAVVFDRESNVLHKHGNVERAKAWLLKTQAVFRAAGFPEMADALVMVQGRFPLEEINRCLENTTYVGKFYERLLSGEIQALPLDWSPEKAAADAAQATDRFFERVVSGDISRASVDTAIRLIAEVDQDDAETQDSSDRANPFMRFRG